MRIYANIVENKKNIIQIIKITIPNLIKCSAIKLNILKINIGK